MEKINLKNLSYFELFSLSEEVNKELESKREKEIINLKHQLKNILEAIQELDDSYPLINNCDYNFDVTDLLEYINFD